MGELNKVYAIELLPGRYEPRSDALLTSKKPKLWVNREGARSRCVYRKRNYPHAKVVAFRLVPVEEGDE